MSNTAYLPEVSLDGRFLRGKSIDNNHTGMVAMRGFDQLAEKDVFIKARDPQLDSNAAMRTSREADVLDSLDHPRIPALVEAYPDADQPYIVTELRGFHPKVAEGFRHNPNPAFAAELCMKALEPLSHAHETGFTHRDVKPANLLMTWEGGVALTDWELALCKDRQLAAETYKDSRYDDWRVTSFGAAWGSKGYMSPEQAEGRYKIQDGRSDLYALGTVLHLFLYGKLPSKSNRHTSENGDADNSRVFTPERAVPSELREVAERALQPEPADRYQSAAEMSEDLERYLYAVGAVAVAA